MKRTFLLATSFSGFALGVLLASFVGCTTAPPTALEQRYFNITTNPPVLVVTTNVIPVTLYKTNEVTQTVTNVQGVTEYKTNTVVVPVQTLQTNVEVVTKTPETYNFAPGAGQQPIKDIGGLIGSFFGAGGIGSTAVAAAFAIWGFLRSKKTYGTAANLVQVIETVRAFVKQLPNGTAYDAALTTWMQQHQAETGTINQVLTLLANEMNEKDAQTAANNIRDSLAALGITLPPVPPKS